MKPLDPYLRVWSERSLKKRRDAALVQAAEVQAGDERAAFLARAFSYEAELLRRAEAELKQLRGGKVVKT